MNHQRFEEWLFADPIEVPLTGQQQDELQAHLQGCESCRTLAAAWLAVEGDLREAVVIEPEAGFTTRWQENLEKERARLHRRQSLAMLGFVLAGAGLLFSSLLLLALPLLNAPGAWFWSGVYQSLQIVDGLASVQESLLNFIRGLTGSVSWIWWVLGLGVLSQLVVMWIISLRLLTNPRSVTR